MLRVNTRVETQGDRTGGEERLSAKLEMMQNEQEKKKGNEEDRLNALVREHVKQLEEKEVARLQEYQQSLEEWLEECMCREFELQKRRQREFNKKMAGKINFSSFTFSI